MVIQCRGKSTETLDSWFLLQSWVDPLPLPQGHPHKIILLPRGLQSSTHQQSWWGLYSEIVVCLKPSVVSGSKRLCLGFFSIFCNKITQQRWGTGERVFLVHSFRLPLIVVMKPAAIWTGYFHSFRSQEQGAMKRWMLSPTCFLCS